MTKFFISEREWSYAHQYLDNVQDGTKLPYSAVSNFTILEQRKGYGDSFLHYKTTHSFIKINGIIYALAQGKGENAIAGKGEFGKVKFMMDEANESHVVKIHEYADPNEIKILESLRYSRGTSLRVDKNKYYTHMYNKGKKLPKIIPELKTDEEFFQLAIDVCQIVDRFHRGHDDQNKIDYAHLDLKLDNITRDEKGRCHLVDFGLSEQDALGYYFPITGTFPYLPAGTHTLGRKFSRQQYDMLALKRVLYMPAKAPCGHPDADPFYLIPKVYRSTVLSKELLEKHNLFSFIDTSDEKTYFREDDRMNGSILVALLINAYLGLQYKNEDLVNQPQLALAISTLYYHGKRSALEIHDALKSRTDINLIAVLGERDEYKKLDDYKMDLDFLAYMEQAKTLTAASTLLDLKNQDQRTQFASVINENHPLGKSLSLLQQHGLQHYSKKLLNLPDLYHHIAAHPEELAQIRTMLLDNFEKFSQDEIKEILEDKELRLLLFYVYEKLNSNYKDLKSNPHLKSLVILFSKNPELDPKLLRSIITFTKTEDLSLWKLFNKLTTTGNIKEIEEIVKNLQFSSQSFKNTINYFDNVGLKFSDYQTMLFEIFEKFTTVFSYLNNRNITVNIDYKDKNLIEKLYTATTKKYSKEQIEALAIIYRHFGNSEHYSQIDRWIPFNKDAESIIDSLSRLKWLHYLPSLLKNNDSFFSNFNLLLLNVVDENKPTIEYLLKSDKLQDFLGSLYQKPTIDRVNTCIILLEAGLNISRIHGLSKDEIKAINIVNKFNPKNKIECYKNILKDLNPNWINRRLFTSNELQKKLMMKMLDWPLGSMEYEEFYNLDETLGELINYASTLEEAKKYLKISKILKILDKKLEKFNREGEEAANSLTQLITKLNQSTIKLSDAIKTGKKPDFHSYRAECIQANNEHRKELESHRGVLGIVDTLLTILASLIVFYPIVYFVQKYQGINYSFFKTDTCKIQDKFDLAIENLGTLYTN